MKHASFTCDRCNKPIPMGSECHQGSTLQWATSAGCVTAKVDLCEGCRESFVEWLGRSWQELYDQNKWEREP